MANESLTVWIDDEKLSCFDKQMLCDKVFARTGKTEKDKSTWTCRDFWKERENIPEEAMEYIHWEALKKALANSPQGTQRWILKHSTGQCRVGRMLYKDGIIKNIVCAQDVENKTKQPSTSSSAERSIHDNDGKREQKQSDNGSLRHLRTQTYNTRYSNDWRNGATINLDDLSTPQIECFARQCSNKISSDGSHFSKAE